MSDITTKKNIGLICSNYKFANNLLKKLFSFNPSIFHLSKKNYKSNMINFGNNYKFIKIKSLEDDYSDLEYELDVKLDILIFFVEFHSKKTLGNNFNELQNLTNFFLKKKIKKNSSSKVVFVLIPSSNKENSKNLNEIYNEFVIGYSRSLAKKFGKLDILINCLYPGFFSKKDINENMLNVSKIPLKRFVDYNDISNSVIFFCSDYNSYTTGQTIYLDGGVNSI